MSPPLLSSPTPSLRRLSLAVIVNVVVAASTGLAFRFQRVRFLCPLVVRLFHRKSIGLHAPWGSPQLLFLNAVFFLGSRFVSPASALTTPAPTLATTAKTFRFLWFVFCVCSGVRSCVCLACVPHGCFCGCVYVLGLLNIVVECHWSNATSNNVAFFSRTSRRRFWFLGASVGHCVWTGEHYVQVNSSVSAWRGRVQNAY